MSRPAVTSYPNSQNRVKFVREEFELGGVATIIDGDIKHLFKAPEPDVSIWRAVSYERNVYR